MMGCCRQVFKSKKDKYRSEPFSVGLSTIVSEYIRRDAVGDEPIIEEDIRSVRGCCPGRCNSSSELRESVSNVKHVMVFLCCFEEWSHDIQCNKVEWPRRWEELQFTPTAVPGIVSCVAWECAYSVVDAGG